MGLAIGDGAAKSTVDPPGDAAPQPRHLSMVPRSCSGDVASCALQSSRSRPAVDAPSFVHPNSVRIAGACESYASQRQYHNVTLTDLCHVSGASERRIRHAFNECYGVSPMAFLRSAALYEVRRVLLLGPTSRDVVSRAASDFGFRHLSRFADQYRSLFGELPSSTVARRAENDRRLADRPDADPVGRRSTQSQRNLDAENDAAYLDAG